MRTVALVALVALAVTGVALATLAPPLAHAAPPPAVHLDEVALLATPVDGDGVWRPVVRVDDLDELAPHEIEDLLEQVAAYVPDSAARVDPHITAAQGTRRLEDLLPAVTPVPNKEAPPRSRPADHPGIADGALSGKAIYLSQCHGLRWYDTLGRFSTQRGNNFDTVEDFHNPEGMNQYLTVYLENAGANVFTVKERDHTAESVIVDDTDPGFRLSGGDARNAGRGWGRQSTWAYGGEPFRSGGTQRVPADGGSVATWTLEAPRDDEYAVYVSWDSAAEHASDAHYRITHAGGVIDRRFDQRVHGSTWQYVDTLWIPADRPLKIELIADSAEPGRFLSIDAARIGGGTGVIERHGETTDRPRWEESAILATQYNGAPPSVYDPWNERDGSDPTARSRWADWEHPSGEDALYLSWHSNATSNGSARGTVTYIYEGNSGAAFAGSSDFAWAVQDELVDAFRTNWEPGWTDRGVKSAAFAEVNPGHNNEMPAILVELAFHDNEVDSAYLKHPQFRLDASRAMYRGTVRYFAERDGTTPVYLPEAPVGLTLTHSESGELRLTWRDGPTGAPYGDSPTGYLVQTSADGRAWDEGFAVTGRSTTLQARAGQTRFVRVMATNDGGISFASEVVGARRSSQGYAPVLVVDAFDRYETGQLEWEWVPFSLGNLRRLDADRINPHDIVVPHGRAIAAARWPFDSVSDERIGDVDLSRYAIIVWATGEESTGDETLSAAQQQVLREFWSGGGALWVSGAELLWDLDAKGSQADRAFATEVLGATMQSDDADTYEATGSGILAGLDLTFEPSLAPYPVEWPDVLASSRPAIATYGSGGVAGVLGERVATFGFPFEAINSAPARGALAAALLPALAPDYEPPDDGDDPIDPDERGENRSEAPGRHPIAETRGCGCQSSPPAAWWALLPALVLLSRRRRAPHRAA